MGLKFPYQMSEVVQEQDGVKFYGRLAKNIATSGFSVNCVVSSDGEMLNGRLCWIQQRKIWHYSIQGMGVSYRNFMEKFCTFVATATGKFPERFTYIT